MAKICQKFLRVQKLSPSLHPMETIMTPHWGVSWGEMALLWSAIKTALQKSEIEQIYAYDFVKEGYFRLLILFLKYYPLDKHFKHGFKIFRPIFHNLLYTIDGYGKYYFVV